MFLQPEHIGLVVVIILIATNALKNQQGEFQPGRGDTDGRLIRGDIIAVVTDHPDAGFCIRGSSKISRHVGPRLLTMRWLDWGRLY